MSHKPTIPLEQIERNKSFVPSSERSEEVQAIVDRMPTKGATFVAYVVIVLVAVVLILGFVISYPDTVDGRISITSSRAPVRLVAQTAGRIVLTASDGASVKAGAVIAYLDNAAKTEEVFAVERMLASSFSESEYDSLSGYSETMGELSGSFNQYRVALGQYLRHVNTDLYTNQINNLKVQIAADEEALRFVDAGKEIRTEAVNMAMERLNKDSILFQHKAITQQDINRQRSEYLNLSESYLNTQSNRSAVAARIDKNRIEIRRLGIEYQETTDKLLSEVYARRSELISQIAVWKERYLLIAPIDGKIEYLGFWRDHGFVKAGEEVISVLPGQVGMLGEVRIPSTGAGKIEVGQKVNVKIENYPYDEFGLIKGKVNKISKLPSLIDTKEGKADTYLVIIEFPEGMTTNYGKQLSVDFETKGVAEIITKDKRLIERLFDNLKSLGTK